MDQNETKNQNEDTQKQDGNIVELNTEETEQVVGGRSQVPVGQAVRRDEYAATLRTLV
jgi:hypothetical protein